MTSRTVQLVVALAVVLSILIGIHYLLWARLVRDPAWPAPWIRVGTVAVWALALSMPLALVATRFAPRAVASVVGWIAFVWMGLAFLLLLAAVGGDLVRLAARFVPGATDPARRILLARTLAAGIGLLGAAAGITATVTALRAFRVRRVRVPLRRLPPELHGFTIVQLSDIHVGPTIGRAFVAEMVRRTNALDPDVVAITGDLVDGSVAELGSLVEPLRDLRARHGVFFVTGNHEYYSGVDEWLAHLGGLGVRVLRNERVTLGRDGATLDLAGVDDWSARRFGRGHGADLSRALAGRDERRELVLLAHQPKAVTEAAARAVGLVLSGHTHGGQIWPFTYLVRLDQPFIAGLHRVEDTFIYVSEGTGYWGPPMRLGTHAEITHVTLERA